MLLILHICSYKQCLWAFAYSFPQGLTCHLPVGIYMWAAFGISGHPVSDSNKLDSRLVHLGNCKH